MIRDVVERHVAHGVDEASLAQAKRLFVDTVGCAIAGTHAPEVRSLEDKLAAIDAGTFNLPNGKGLGVHGRCASVRDGRDLGRGLRRSALRAWPSRAFL